MTHSDIAIIGGGMIGCSLAYYLSKAGLHVEVFEENKIAQGTTKAAGGMLGAHSEYIDEHFYSFARMSQELYKQFTVDSIKPFDYTVGGIIQYMANEHEIDHFKRWEHAKFISRQSFQEQFPLLTTPSYGAYLFEDDVHVHPEKTCFAFYHSAKALGASFHEQTKIKAIEHSENGVYIQTNEEEIFTQKVVIASGIGTQTFLPDLQLSATKGQCVQLQANGHSLPFTLFEEGTYVISRPDHTFVIGATMEDDTDDLHTNLQGMQELQEISKRFSPLFTTLPIIRHWAGLRPKSVDGLPYIGQVPNQKNVYVASGHFRNGVLLAPATAVLIKKMLLNEYVNPEWKHAFRIERGIKNEQNNSIERRLVSTSGSHFDS